MEKSKNPALAQSDWFWILGLLALTFLPRLVLLSASQWVIDADEAIVGLMAKHITEGRDWPVFYYGQNYLGSLESILTAAVFWFSGPGNVALRVVPLIFSGIFTVQIYLLALRLTARSGALAEGRLAARIAGLLAALPAAAFVLWSTKARGGFIEVLVLGNWALLWTESLLSQKRSDPWQLFGLAAVLGLGWWVNNQIIFYIFAIGAALGWQFICERGFVESLRAALLAATGFFLGGLPFWWHNLFAMPRFQTFSELGGFATPEERVRYLGGFFSESLPILLGARRFWSTEDVFSYSALLAYVVYGLLALLLIVVSAHLRHRRNLLLVFLLGVPLIFSISKFGWLSIAPRYLLPFYSVLFPACGLALARLWMLGGPARVAGSALLVGALGLNLSSNYLGGVAVPGEPFVHAGTRVARDQAPLYAWLRENGFFHVHTNYWIGYRMAFETNEEITFSVFGEPATKRIPEYELLTDEERAEHTAYVLVPSEAEIVQTELAAEGYEFERALVGPYVVLHDMRLPSNFKKLRPVALRPEQLSTEFRADWLPRLVDGRVGTRWGSGTPQVPGMEIEIDLGAPGQIVAALVLQMGFWPHDHARGLMLEGQEPDGTWCLLADLPVDEQAATYNLFFAPRILSRLRLTQTGSNPIFDWSIAELELYGPGISKGAASQSAVTR